MKKFYICCEESLSFLIVVLAYSGLVVIFLVVFLDSFALVVCQRLGTENKKETLEILVFGMSGLIALHGLFSFNKRVKAQVKNNELIEKGYSQERFKTAVEHLASKEKESLRIFSFHEFFHLARDNKDNYDQTVMDVLCHHLQSITNYSDALGREKHKQEVRALIKILFGFRTRDVFNELKINLQKVNLSYVHFPDKTNLRGANLDNACLCHAFLSDAFLSDSRMYGGQLLKAHLYGADLSNAKLNYANLRGARFHGADLNKACLLDTDLRGAQLGGSKNLDKAELGGAKYNDETNFPSGFAFQEYGMRYVPPDADE